MSACWVIYECVLYCYKLVLTSVIFAKMLFVFPLLSTSHSGVDIQWGPGASQQPAGEPRAWSEGLAAESSDTGREWWSICLSCPPGWDLQRCCHYRAGDLWWEPIMEYVLISNSSSLVKFWFHEVFSCTFNTAWVLNSTMGLQANWISPPTF